MSDNTNLIPTTARALKEWRHFRTTIDNKELFVYNPDNGKFEAGMDSLVESKVQEILADETRNFLVRETIDFLKRGTLIERHEFEKDKGWVNVKNGMVNLITGELAEHDPKFLSLKQIPVTYQPEADCPRFKQFLTEVVSPEDAQTIIKFWGYTLAPICNMEKALVTVGEGENGKSVLLYTATEFFGRDNISSESLTSLCDNHFRVAELFGKVANIKSELSPTKPNQLEMFKALVSGTDTITGERKHQHPFRFLNNAKLWFSCNKLPNVSFEEKAYYRRWIVINFPNTFVKGENADVNLPDKLTNEEEKSGILNLALKGYQQLVKDGGFIEWNSVEKVKQCYVALAGDDIARFVMECVTIDKEATCTMDEFYNKYCKFTEMKLGILPNIKETFYRRLWGIFDKDKHSYRSRHGEERTYFLRGFRVKEGL